MKKVRFSFYVAIAICALTLIFSQYVEGQTKKIAPPEVAGKYKLEIIDVTVEGRQVTVNGIHNFGPKVTPTWNWGDGTTEKSMFPGSHTYRKPGSYKISLTLIENTTKGIVKKTARKNVKISGK